MIYEDLEGKGEHSEVREFAPYTSGIVIERYLGIWVLGAVEVRAL
jgi:hypothetical protein